MKSEPTKIPRLLTSKQLKLLTFVVLLGWAFLYVLAYSQPEAASGTLFISPGLLFVLFTNVAVVALLSYAPFILISLGLAAALFMVATRRRLSKWPVVLFIVGVVFVIGAAIVSHYSGM
ncbi:hypothetical protein ABZ769_11475 [Streptomyces olivoreticuli]